MSARDLLNRETVVGDVIQIEPDFHIFGGAFAVVTDAKGWGVRCDVYGLRQELYPVRLAGNQFVRIGKPHWRFD